MNIDSFVKQDQFAMIQDRVNRKQVFAYEQSAKGSSNKITLSLIGRYIAKDLADSIWHGNDYLVSINVNYHGEAGIGGSGYAIDHFEKFASWDSFKTWIDAMLERFDDYEADGQMCLF